MDSVSSTERVSWSLVILTVNRTSPALTARTTTRQVACLLGGMELTGAMMMALPLTVAGVWPEALTYCCASSSVHVILTLVAGALPWLVTRIW